VQATCRVEHYTDDVTDDNVVGQYTDVGMAQSSKSVMPHFIQYCARGVDVLEEAKVVV